MGAPDIIFQLRKKGYSICADGGYLDISPAEDLAPEIVEQLKRNKQEILTELQKEKQKEKQQEVRQQKVLALLQENPETQRAVVADSDSSPHHVILTIALRQVAVFEMLADKARFDPFQLLTLMDKATTH